jgi:hypothetical protein
MVNQALESFKEWVDDIIVEIVPPVERDAEDAKEKSEISAEEEKQSYATKNIELRGKSGTATLIKAHLWQKNLGITQCEELSNMSGKLVWSKKRKLATCREERGKLEASISAEIVMMLEKYKA